MKVNQYTSYFTSFFCSVGYLFVDCFTKLQVTRKKAWVVVSYKILEMVNNALLGHIINRREIKRQKEKERSEE